MSEVKTIKCDSCYISVDPKTHSKQEWYTVHYLTGNKGCLTVTSSPHMIDGYNEIADACCLDCVMRIVGRILNTGTHELDQPAKTGGGV